jgi:hypothetical protein
MPQTAIGSLSFSKPVISHKDYLSSYPQPARGEKERRQRKKRETFQIFSPGNTH